ncbi:hypothetical protein Clacol_008605 [Clathrus columnatus]|uniref:Para-hydroxybenzoate--polyprenyltransferase n=1 Tax=Clathrus columnatus TaxID=1419009 RepID=A0AAV5AI73_9AGAM|nr:hypothetical protein Clacol_008605 [Clathrus columnatus]
MSYVAWGVMLAAIDKQIPFITVLKATFAYHIFGGYVLHSAGSIWNDIIDKDLDALVERTKNRPLPSGRISVSATLLFLFPQVVLMAAMMYFYTNKVAFTLGMIGLFFWVPLYPFMKRITYWPQAWLGIAGNWGLLVAYASLTGEINFNTAGVLFVGTWCWCMHYDTIYGMMDKKDDARVGIKSTALLFGSSARPILAAFALGFLAALYLCGLNLGASNIYYSLAVGGSALHLTWQLVTVDFDSNPSCFKMFTSNAKQLAYFVYFGLVSVYLSKS